MGHWVEDDEKPKDEDRPETDADLLNLYAEVLQAKEEEESSKQAWDDACKRTIETRMNFLREKAAKHGFVTGALFSLEKEVQNWVNDPKQGWITQKGIEVFPFCIFRGVDDYYDTDNRIYRMANAMPTIQYSTRLKSGRWSAKIQSIWAPTLEELERMVRFL